MHKPVIRGQEAAVKLLKEYKFETILDIGSGKGEATALFNLCGKYVTAIDPLFKPHFAHEYLKETFETVDLKNRRFECIWACHVLEHVRNPGLFLDKCFLHLADNGVFVVTVPPRKDNLVGGHLTLWTCGILLYNLVLAGFDCSQAAVKQYEYNISVIVRKKLRKNIVLKSGNGDLETLTKYFPFPVRQDVLAHNLNINWDASSTQQCASGRS
jgi:SAM-dependent methyltransferase